jgi:hypothetical protein
MLHSAIKIKRNLLTNVFSFCGILHLEFAQLKTGKDNVLVIVFIVFDACHFSFPLLAGPGPGPLLPSQTPSLTLSVRLLTTSPAACFVSVCG